MNWYLMFCECYAWAGSWTVDVKATITDQMNASWPSLQRTVGIDIGPDITRAAIHVQWSVDLTPILSLRKVLTSYRTVFAPDGSKCVVRSRAMAAALDSVAQAGQFLSINILLSLWNLNLPLLSL